MKPGPGSHGFDEAVKRLAAEAAPALLDQVLEESRRAAAEILKRRLTAALVEETESLLRRSGAERGHSSPEETPTVVPLVRPETDPEPCLEMRPQTPARQGWYVYGITGADTAGALDVASGVDGAPVEVFSVDDLAVVVSPLADTAGWDVQALGEAALEALAPRARAHEAVLERVMDVGAVLPLRFGVLYPDVDRLEAVLRRRSGALRSALGALDGHSEWGLTITSEEEEEDARPAPTAAAAAGEGAPPASPDGRDYLSRRREARLAAEARADRLARAGSDLHQDLQALATAAVTHRASSSSGRASDVVLRASYLVRTGSTEAFRDGCEALLTGAPPELQLRGELTGPWPPYHFCDVSLEEVPA